MKKTKWISSLLLIFSVLLAISSVILSFYGLQRKPILLKPPSQTETLVETLMEGIGTGDFTLVSEVLAGNPDLGDWREPEDPVGRLLYYGYLKSFTLEKIGPCHPVDSGIGAEVCLSYLDMESALEPLRDQVSTLLQKRIREAKNPAELYDSEGRYQELLIEEVLGEGAWNSLQKNGTVVKKNLIVCFVYEIGSWKISPEPEILNLLTGNMED